MTKADLVSVICERTEFSGKEAIELVDELLEVIKGTLEAEEEVKIAGFGKFVVKRKTERRGRNPQTGEEITIDGRKILSFKPSGILKGRLNA